MPALAFAGASHETAALHRSCLLVWIDGPCGLLSRYGISQFSLMHFSPQPLFFGQREQFLTRGTAWAKAAVQSARWTSS